MRSNRNTSCSVTFTLRAERGARCGAVEGGIEKCAQHTRQGGQWACKEQGQLPSKSPSHEPSSCKLSKIGMCTLLQQETRTGAIHMSHEWPCSLPSISCCWWPFSSTISHLHSLLHQELFWSVPSMPAPVCQLLYCTVVFLKVLYCKIKDAFSVFCVKSITNLLQHSII